MTPIRMAYGEALKELGSFDSRVVVLEADVGGSSKSQIFGQSPMNGISMSELQKTI